MLTIEDAILAKIVLDRWTEDNHLPRLSSEDAETLETVLLSPAGKAAASNLRETLWLLRDLSRCGYGKIGERLKDQEIEDVLDRLETYRADRGDRTTKETKATAAAILMTPIGRRAAYSIARLDAVVTLLFKVRPS